MANEVLLNMNVMQVPLPGKASNVTAFEAMLLL